MPPIRSKAAIELARQLGFFNWPPLCIETINTGSSIDLKFKPAGQYLPSFKRTENGDLEIWLPKCSAAVVVTGLFLSWGLSTADSALDFYTDHIRTPESTQSEYLAPQAESDRIRKFKEGLEQLELHRFRDPINFGTRQLGRYRREFRRQIGQQNIHDVQTYGRQVDDSGKE